MKIEKFEDNSKREQTINNNHDELSTAVIILQTKVDSRLDLTSSTMQMLETSITLAGLALRKCLMIVRHR